MKNITAIIVTFNRSKSLNKLILSIRNFYNDLPIIVVDNGGEDQAEIRKDALVEFYKVPFDSGLSFSRNYAVERVKTKYFLLLDDDFEFTEQTKIEKLVEIAEKGKFDIVGGAVENLEYHGLLEKKHAKLLYVKGDRGECEGYPLYDMVLNFFLANTQKIRKHKWDNELKLAEHTDFFLRAKENHIKITYEPDVWIKHNHDRDENYTKFRIRGKFFMQKFMEKHRIDVVENFAGVKTYRQGTQLEKKITKRKNDVKFVDFCITTFKRPQALRRLILSIAKYYSNANIYIADQNEKADREFYSKLREEAEKAGMVKRFKVFFLPYDCGISAARNHLVRETPNRFKLILDDDFIFTDKTNIGLMVRAMESSPGVGIVGGLVKQLGNEIHFEFIPKKDGKTLYHAHDGNHYRIYKGIKYKKTGCVLNFVLMRSDIFSRIRWDESLKVTEHLDFYIRFNELVSYKIIYCPEIEIEHQPVKLDNNYKELRQRSEFQVAMMRKHGINKIKYLNGQVTEISEDGKSIKRYREQPENFDKN